MHVFASWGLDLNWRGGWGAYLKASFFFFPHLQMHPKSRCSNPAISTDTSKLPIMNDWCASHPVSSPMLPISFPSPHLDPCVPHPLHPAPWTPTACCSTLRHHHLPGMGREGSLYTAVAANTWQQVTFPTSCLPSLSPPSLPTSSPSLLAVLGAGHQRQRAGGSGSGGGTLPLEPLPSPSPFPLPCPPCQLLFMGGEGETHTVPLLPLSVLLWTLMTSRHTPSQRRMLS